MPTQTTEQFPKKAKLLPNGNLGLLKRGRPGPGVKVVAISKEAFKLLQNKKAVLATTDTVNDYYTVMAASSSN